MPKSPSTKGRAIELLLYEAKSSKNIVKILKEEGFDNVSPATIDLWRKELDSKLEERGKERKTLEDMILDFAGATLALGIEMGKNATDPAWLAKNSVDDQIKLHGHLHAKAADILRLFKNLSVPADFSVQDTEQRAIEGELVEDVS